MSFHAKHKRRFVQNMILCMLPVVLASGCIIIPIPSGEKPYYYGAIPNLEIGATSKNEVIAEFGVPDVTYRQGSELVYVESFSMTRAIKEPLRSVSTGLSYPPPVFQRVHDER